MIRDIKQDFLTPEVYAIYSLCMYAPTFERFAEKAHVYMAAENTDIYGFFVEDRLLGVIVLRHSIPNCPEIIGIAVDRSYQHRHIGRRLVEYAAARNPRAELCAETDDDAVRFYEHCGFRSEEFYTAYNQVPCKRYRCVYPCHSRTF